MKDDRLEGLCRVLADNWQACQACQEPDCLSCNNLISQNPILFSGDWRAGLGWYEFEFARGYVSHKLMDSLERKHKIAVWWSRLGTSSLYKLSLYFDVSDDGKTAQRRISMERLVWDELQGILADYEAFRRLEDAERMLAEEEKWRALMKRRITK